jgi:hypothetical protein
VVLRTASPTIAGYKRREGAMARPALQRLLWRWRRGRGFGRRQWRDGQFGRPRRWVTQMGDPRRFVIYSGVGILEGVDRRPDAKSAHQHVIFLTSIKRPNIRVFHPDGRPMSLDELCRLAGEGGS